MRTSDNTDQIYRAMFNAQQELDALVPEGVGNHKHKYIKIDQWLKAVLDVSKKFELVAFQNFTIENDKNVFFSRIVHVPSGQWLEARKLMLETNDLQKTGGELTYTRRYALDGWFMRGSDDDDIDSVNYANRAQKKEEQKKPIGGIGMPKKIDAAQAPQDSSEQNQKRLLSAILLKIELANAREDLRQIAEEAKRELNNEHYDDSVKPALLKRSQQFLLQTQDGWS